MFNKNKIGYKSEFVKFYRLAVTLNMLIGLKITFQINWILINWQIEMKMLNDLYSLSVLTSVLRRYECSKNGITFKCRGM